jgi:hypothetical protein
MASSAAGACWESDEALTPLSSPSRTELRRPIANYFGDLHAETRAQWLSQNEDALKKRQLSADLPKVI